MTNTDKGSSTPSVPPPENDPIPTTGKPDGNS